MESKAVIEKFYFILIINIFFIKKIFIFIKNSKKNK